MNSKKLKSKIIASGIKYKAIAKFMGLSYYGLQKKINNETEFKASEIVSLCKILNINDPEIKEEIFYGNM